MNNLIEPLVFIDKERDRYISLKLTKMDLASLRKSSGYTQREVSELGGLSISCINGIESDDGNPTFRSILKYLDVLGYELSFKKKSI